MMGGSPVEARAVVEAEGIEAVETSPSTRRVPRSKDRRMSDMCAARRADVVPREVGCERAGWNGLGVAKDGDRVAAAIRESNAS